MALRIHLAATIAKPPAGPLEVVTACGRKGYKHPQLGDARQPDGEWQAVAQIGGLEALRARPFDALMASPRARHACAQCRARWTAGEDGAA